MREVKVYDNGYEMHLRSERTPGGNVPDPWTIREVVFEADPGTPDAALEEAAQKYAFREPWQTERARVFEDEEADAQFPAKRLLRVFFE